MKYGDKKIELKHETTSSGRRRYFYRVVPSELSLLDRLFRNKWKELYRYSVNSKFGLYLTWLFSPEDYYEKLAGLKTVADVEAYLFVERVLAMDSKSRDVAEHKTWED